MDHNKRKVRVGFIALSFVAQFGATTVSANPTDSSNRTEKLQHEVRALSMEEYLSQVAKNNGFYVSSELAGEGASLRSGEWSLLTKPSLIASVTYSDDQREAASALAPTRTKTQVYSLGVAQQTDFGLQARLLYNHTNNDLTYTATSGLPAGFLPAPVFSISGPVLELTQSFGRNGFGAETQATQALLAAQALATKYTERFRQSILRADAESAFWRLALAREAVEATKDTLSRAQKIKDLNARRVKMELADNADALQANANYLARMLELQVALDEERAASRSFNSIRGIDNDQVPETLPALSPELIQSLRIPKRVDARDDLKAADERRKIAEANAQIGIEKNKPVVEAFGSVGLNGRDPSTGEAISESFGTDHPNYAIGVRVTMPLDLATLERDREGYRLEKRAAEVSFRRTAFEQERLWNDLNKRFTETSQRLELARNIEVAQKKKLDNERERQRRGRSTTFQVIQFEQDFANAQLARIRTQAELLNIFAQLRTFGGGQ